jgi:hypothetical protein
MITARVSHVAAFARWKADEESDVDWLINDILSDKPSEAMLKGTAFHKFLEHAQAGESETAQVDGYSFIFAGDFNLYLPRMREWRKGKDYGGIIVSGQVDAIEGKCIYDHKTTERFDAERYLDGWQWRYYLDLFEADRFVWNVWEMKHLGESFAEDPIDDQPSETVQSYEVRSLHELTAYRYPAMGDDCRDLALEYRAFALRYMPQLDKEVAA